MHTAHKEFDPAFWNDFRQGKETAFNQLFRGYFIPLTRYAWTIVKDESIAEDIVQDCFLRLWEKRKDLPAVKHLRSYLYRSVHNASINKIERRKLKIVREEPKDTVEEIDETAIIEAELIARIAKVLDLLPPRMQQVMRLHYFEDKSLKEIGEITGTSYRNAKQARYKGLQYVRNILSSAKSILGFFP